MRLNFIGETVSLANPLDLLADRQYFHSNESQGTLSLATRLRRAVLSD